MRRLDSFAEMAARPLSPPAFLAYTCIFIVAVCLWSLKSFQIVIRFDRFHSHRAALQPLWGDRH